MYTHIGMEYLFLEDFQNAKFNFMKSAWEVNWWTSAALFTDDFLEQEAIDYLNMF
jgi:hypothetical protein